MKKEHFLFDYIVAVIIYGSIGLLLNYVDASSEFVVLCRGSIGFVVIVLSFFIKGRKIDFAAIKRNLPMLILSGIMLGMNWVVLFAGFRIAVGVASLCNYFAPIILIIISPIVFKEKITPRQFVCVVVSVIGVILISGILEPEGGSSMKAAAYGLLAAVAFVLIVICNKRLKEIKPMEKTAVQLLVSALTVLPFVIIQDGFPRELDTRSVIILVILGVVHTGYAYILYFDSVTHITVEQVAIYGYLEPVVGVITSCIFLGEVLSPIAIVGTILIIAVAFEPLIGRRKTA